MKLTVSDNGTGFDVNEASSRTGLRGSLGLMSMQERANLIGAKLNILSQIGRGTTVTVSAE